MKGISDKSVVLSVAGQSNCWFSRDDGAAVLGLLLLTTVLQLWEPCPCPALSLLPQSAVFRTWPFLGETADNFYNEKYLLIIFMIVPPISSLIEWKTVTWLTVLFRCQWRTKAFKHLPFPNDILLTEQLTRWSYCCVCLFKITKALSASKIDTSSSIWAEAVNWVCLFWQTQRWLHMYPWEHGFLSEVFFCFCSVVFQKLWILKMEKRKLYLAAPFIFKLVFEQWI